MNSRQKGLDRLRALKPGLNEAAAEMAIERGRFDAIRDGGATIAVSAFNLFQTPAPIAWELAGLIPDGARVLEPSAGLGRLIEAIDKRSNPSELVAVENAPQCSAVLFGLGLCRLIQADFLKCDSERLGGLFDAVVMNPPFKMGTDIKHIKHAFEMLKPGGLLVALCFDGVKQNRELRPWADSWEVLPDNSFKAEGTSASVVKLTKHK